ncbi:GDP-L-fucose synthase family protein [Thermoproteota archaeon]
MNKNAKIYIPGHTGLVGSAIYNNLIEKGYTNLIIRTHAELDLCNQRDVEGFFTTHKPDYVFLSAAKVGGIKANTNYRADFIYDNLQIQNNIIYQSWKTGVKKLLFLGSSCIYPRVCPQPIKEEYLLTSELEHTNEPYAIAKIAGLKLCESFNFQYNTNFICVMPTNVYGKEDNFDLDNSHVLAAMIRKMLLAKAYEAGDFSFLKENFLRFGIKKFTNTQIKNFSEEKISGILNEYGITPDSVTLWGTGAPRREFIFNKDLADACVFLMETINAKDLVTDKSVIKNTHINIGTGIDISIKKLAELVKKTTGYMGAVNWDHSKPDGTMEKRLDITKLASLGWNPQTSLEQGLMRVVNSI